MEHPHAPTEKGMTGAHDPTGEAALATSIGFLRECLEATPLRRYLGLFEASEILARENLRGAFRDAGGIFESDLTRFQLAFETAEDLFEHLWLAPGLQATYLYRLSRALHLAGDDERAGIVCVASRQITGIEIYYSADIGPGLKIIHGLAIVIGAACRIGSHFTVYQGVTIGDKLGTQTGGRPVIGDHVIAGAGSKLLGPIEIGSKVVIAANAVVLGSLPSLCVAAGIPARVAIADLSDAQFEVYRRSIRW
jgi:serine O-acetyltransferase